MVFCPLDVFFCGTYNIQYRYCRADLSPDSLQELSLNKAGVEIVRYGGWISLDLIFILDRKSGWLGYHRTESVLEEAAQKVFLVIPVLSTSNGTFYYLEIPLT